MGIGFSGGILPIGFCDAVRIAAPEKAAVQAACVNARHEKVLAGSNPDAVAITARLGSVLDDMELASSLQLPLVDADGTWRAPALDALLALAEQCINMGIDYSTLGLGWQHPRSRMEYRTASHPSQMAQVSRERAWESRRHLVKIATAVVKGEMDVETAVTETFVREIGLSPDAKPALAATFSGVSAALGEELLLPLRALNEGLAREDVQVQTMSGEVVSKAELQRTVEALTVAVLSKEGGFAEWRYSNAVGSEQLRGLSGPQARQWQHPFTMEHEGGLRTHEDQPGELGLFWATKIGGPSHGFDFEGQCHLPLLANARNKVVLVSDPAWLAHPAARAHFRLLWTAPENGSGIMPEPRLWLEAVNCDFDAATVNKSALTRAVLAHAVEKSEAMGVPLSLHPSVLQELAMVSKERRWQGSTRLIHEKIALRPSNGVCEASDFLTSKHDWVQVQEEVTEPIARALYAPASCKAVGIRQALGCVL